MSRRLITSLALLPLVTACSLFEGRPTVPPRPAMTGVTAQDAAWQSQIKQVRGEQQPLFEPLVRAREAVEQARAQTAVERYDAESLAAAEAALEKAESGWAEIATQDMPSSDKLATVARDAHRAQRLAEIARYTAQRELGLEALVAANEQLKEHRAAAGKAAASSGDVRPVSDKARALIGQRIVPDRLGDVSFETGTARIKPESAAVVRALADFLQAYPTVGIAIFGHTDNVAPAQDSIDRFVDANPELQQQAPSHSEKVRAFNLALSAARARAVAQLLVDSGVSARRIGARGFGDSRPVASNDTEAGRRANRRIEAVVVPGPDSPEVQRARAAREQP